MSMRERAALVAAAVGCCGVIAIGQEQPALENLCQNGGFEELDERGAPTGWELAPGADGAIAMDNAQLYTGGLAARIQHAAPATSTLTQECEVGAETYTLLCWMKVSGVAGAAGAGAAAQVLNPDGAAIGQALADAATEQWQAVQVTFNPGDAARVLVRVGLVNAAGAGWLDEVTLAPAGQVAALLGEAAGPARGENVALHKPYTYSPAPSYEYCTDPEDVIQLTDGVYTRGYFWTQKTTVGWLRTDPQIVIDLGRAYPVEGIAINLAGGGRAGVFFPQAVHYYVSDDDESYYRVATLSSEELLQDERRWYTHQFVASDLGTRGRYVMIECERRGNMTFTDEIEVYRGEHDPGEVRFAGEPLNKLAMAYAKYTLAPDSFQLATSPETPHVKWARPLAGGPINALILAPNESMREVVELAQRLEMDYLPVGHFKYRDKGPLALLWQQEIARGLPEAEVMVITGTWWESVPEDLLGQIMARVREGMGLVLVSPRQATEQAEPLLSESPVEGDEGIPGLVALGIVPGAPEGPRSPLRLSTYGEGRVAALNHAAYTRRSDTLLPIYGRGDLDDDEQGTFEYAFSLLAKTICWAAKRETRAIAALQAAPERVTVTVAAGRAGKLECVVRDELFDVQRTFEQEVGEGGGELAFELPALGHGVHPVDCWLRDGEGKVIDWGSGSYTTEREAHIGEVVTDEEHYQPEAPVRVQVSLEGEPGGCRVVAWLQDCYDRVLERREVEVAPGRGMIEVELTKRGCLTLALELLVELRRGEEVLDREFRTVWVRRPPERDFEFCAWYSLMWEPIATWAYRTVRELGVDTVVALSNDQRYYTAAFSNVRFGPENVYRVVAQNREGAVREPCLTDPATIEMVRERIGTLCGGGYKWGSTEVSMGDESSLGSYGSGHDFCQSPTCLAGFRDYLKEQYGDLAGLNGEWETDFGGWEEVTPWTREEMAGQENLARWLDHRRYMESVFAEFHEMCRDEVLAMNPEARVGISGTPRPNSYSGHDWYKLMGIITHLSGYGGMQREMQRSLAREDAFVSTFTGYDYADNDELKARSAPWDMVLNGSEGMNYYTLVSNTLNCPIFRPDLSRTRKAAWIEEEVKAVKAGPGKLLLHAERQHDGVAVHYSQASVHAATATGLMGYQEPMLNFGNNLSALGDILRDLQVQYDFIAPEQIEQGRLSEYRALILPWSQCVGAKEAGAIVEWVGKGGTVIADMLPALRDEHGKPAPGLLDEVFPADRARRLEAVGVAETVLPGGEFGEEARAIVVAARAGEEAPVTPRVSITKQGAGQGVLLNFCASNYSETEAGGVAGEVLEKKEGPEQVRAGIRALWRRLLESAGVRAGVELTAAEGDAPGVEAVRFASGPAQLVGLLEVAQGGPVDRARGRTLEMRLPAKGHLYDCRAGKYLGEAQAAEVRVVPGLAQLYAVLPAPIEALEIAAPKEAAAGTDVLISMRLRAAQPIEQVHVVRLEAMRPDGQPFEPYAQNVLLERGRGEASVPLAVNDPAGTWRLVCRDVATGVSAAAEVSVGR